MSPAEPRQHCCDPRRLEVLRALGSANAIEFVEVRDRAEPDPALRQRSLFLRLLRRDASIVDGGGALILGPNNLRLSGGERIREVGVEWVALADALPPGVPADLVAGIDEPQRTLVVRTAARGDFSRYTLALVAGAGSDAAPPGFDPLLARIAFGFKVECPTPYDCAAESRCPPAVPPVPEIDYLARDYESLRRMMLERLALTAPGWRERSAADLGVTLVELLAYAADRISYRQDAIATEAYLATARRRVSVRRHVRLVDYRLHEGCNARAWVHFEAAGNGVALARGTQLLSRIEGAPVVLAPASRVLAEAIAAGVTVFETVRDETLHADLDRFAFYTWGDAACCLPRGSVRATLRGHHPLLAPGACLALVETVSPTTGVAGDADRTHRHIVRLTEVVPAQDPSGRLFDDPPLDAPLAVTEIAWSDDDALPFALCLSVRAFPGLAVSEAWGNLVLADHGRTVEHNADHRDPAWQVPAPTLFVAPPADAPPGCDAVAPLPVAPRFAPRLPESPLAHGFDLDAMLAVPPDDPDEGWASAARFAGLAARDALPLIALESALGADTRPWTAQRDLLASTALADDFVVEIDDARRAQIRFGDDVHGRRPDSGTLFAARLRLGGGSAGNLGAMALAHVVSANAAGFVSLANPLPAFGGTEPEDLEAARRDAPQAFRTPERAVTADDYARAAERRSEVARAAATLRWTGSWHTAFVTADRRGGLDVDPPFERQLRRHLERFRMAGVDLEIDSPRFVALDLRLQICVAPGHFRSDVEAAVRELLGSTARADGSLGWFHPDRLSFGEPVYLSPIIAAVQAIEGVESVAAQRFQRLVRPSPTTLADGVIAIGRLEVARLDDDPNFREHGRLELAMGGGL